MLELVGVTLGCAVAGVGVLEVGAVDWPVAAVAAAVCGSLGLVAFGVLVTGVGTGASPWTLALWEPLETSALVVLVSLLSLVAGVLLISTTPGTETETGTGAEMEIRLLLLALCVELDSDLPDPIEIPSSPEAWALCAAIAPVMLVARMHSAVVSDSSRDRRREG